MTGEPVGVGDGDVAAGDGDSPDGEGAAAAGDGAAVAPGVVDSSWAGSAAASSRPGRFSLAALASRSA